jgi:hypothetical protein
MNGRSSVQILLALYFPQSRISTCCSLYPKGISPSPTLLNLNSFRVKLFFKFGIRLGKAKRIGIVRMILHFIWTQNLKEWKNFWIENPKSMRS